jgi:hypothetical protein
MDVFDQSHTSVPSTIEIVRTNITMKMQKILVLLMLIILVAPRSLVGYCIIPAYNRPDVICRGDRVFRNLGDIGSIIPTSTPTNR